MTTLNNGVYNCINNNPFEISTDSSWPGNLNSYIKKHSCVKIGNDSVRLVKFDNLSESIVFMVSFMGQVINNVEPLKALNVDVDINKSYGKALFQLAFTTWLTPLAFKDGLDALGIKNKTIETFSDTNGLYSTSVYNNFVNVFTTAYEYFKQNP